jgi:nucleotide-binding universal stress UspA family protein
MSERAFRVLVAHDFTPEGEAALLEAATIASEKPAAELHVLNVGNTASAADIELELRACAEAALGAAHAWVPVAIHCHVLRGPVTAAILGLANALEVDLLVVGTHGRKHRFLRAIADRVACEADCPVLVVRRRSLEQHPELVPDPPCPDCVRLRRVTAGGEVWCEFHARPWVPAHRYTYRGGDIHPYHSDRS